MRDGVRLASDLWIPQGGPAPTLLLRLPYGKDVHSLYGSTIFPSIFGLVEAGYAVVVQDCRGTFGSEGTFTALVDEPNDGADSVAWLREQPWCDGNVGSYGGSYLGVVQWATASQAPAGLRAIAPSITSTDWYRAPLHSEGGALSWHAVWFWSTLMTLTEAQRAMAAGAGDGAAFAGLAGMLSNPQAHLGVLPISNQPLLAKCPWWSDWLGHADRDDYWQHLAVAEHLEVVTTPALNVGGWFDIFVSDTTRSFTKMRVEAGSPEAREGQQLIIGPWDHLNYSGVYHDRQFGLSADAVAADLTGAHIRFFDRWVRGRTDALDGTAPVRLFVMGIDEWREEQDWPLPDTQYTEYFLDGSGGAHTAEGDGVLRTEPASVEATDVYVYDPTQPVPTMGGRLMLPSALNAAGPVDQRPVEARDDVLCFTTPALEEPLEVTGHVSLVLHVASSARDTDFTGKLVDVFPDGRAIYLTDGILRARYRDSLAEPELLEPEKVYEVTLDLSVTSNVFRPGHRIRLEISSSNFPRYDRNTNTGGVIAEDTAQQAVVATNRVMHGPEHPSRLILPLIRR
jgi:putative CocE/NonD family hydrolase